MAQSSIEWTEMTWNPTTGCSKVSAGCKFCYAEVMTNRLQAMGLAKYADGFAVRTHPETLAIPYSWKKPKIVFVNSMSDLFHPEVPFNFIEAVFKVMNDNPKHIFQVLTKRAERLYQCSPSLIWTDNIWMGVSVENEKVVDRISFLKDTNAKTKFLSCEPLLGPLEGLDLEGIHWVIVGGESGRGAIRPMSEEWVIDLKNQCQQQRVPFFFKQWGGTNKKVNGRTLQGETHSQMPSREVIRAVAVGSQVSLDFS